MSARARERYCVPGGRRMSDDSAEQSDAHQLLTQANLHRLRGELAEAESKCRAAIAADPRNAEAHALLGDLCVAQHQMDEGVRAYRAALELGENEDVQRKLDEVLAARAKAAGEALRRTAQPRRKVLESPQSRLIAACIFAAAAILLATVLVWSQVRGTRRPQPVTTQTQALATAPSPKIVDDDFAADITVPTTTPRSSGAAWGQSARPGRTPTARPHVQRSRSVSAGDQQASRNRNVISIARIPAPLTDREKRLVHELSQIRLSDDNPIGTPFVSASIDPATEHLVITFEVPTEVSRKPSRSFMQMEAQRLLLRSAQVDKRFRTASVRVIVGWTDPKTGARHKDVAFRADSRRGSIEAVGAVGPGQARETIFDKIWWNPDIGKSRPPAFTSR